MTGRNDFKQQALTVRQASRILGSTPILVRKLIKSRLIRSFKLGPRKTMIPMSEVERIVKLDDVDIWEQRC